MKQIILLQVFSLIILQLVAQTKTVTIHGIVKDTTVKRIEMSHVVDATLTKFEDDTLNVLNGQFSASIQIPFPTEIAISHGSKVYFKNYIYNDAEILIDSTGEPHVIGSHIQDEYEQEFLPFFHLDDKVFDSLQTLRSRNYTKYGNDLPKSIQDSVTLLREKFYRQRAELLRQYIKRHPDSYVALWDIYYYVGIPPVHQYFDFEKLLSSFSNRMQKQSFINALRGKIRGTAKMQVGQIFAKDFFKGYAQMGSKIKSNNQYYLIDFWYSHCTPCAAQFPKLKEIYNQFHGKGFDIVSISVDKQKDKKDYVAAINKYGLAWNHVWDRNGVLAKNFNINVFPTYILVDKNGIIINANIQGNELEAFLKKSLGSL